MTCAEHLEQNLEKALEMKRTAMLVMVKVLVMMVVVVVMRVMVMRVMVMRVMVMTHPFFITFFVRGKLIL